MMMASPNPSAAGRDTKRTRAPRDDAQEEGHNCRHAAKRCRVVQAFPLLDHHTGEHQGHHRGWQVTHIQVVNGRKLGPIEQASAATMNRMTPVPK
jgi:hypothetical protein